MGGIRWVCGIWRFEAGFPWLGWTFSGFVSFGILVLFSVCLALKFGTFWFFELVLVICRFGGRGYGVWLLCSKISDNLEFRVICLSRWFELGGFVFLILFSVLWFLIFWFGVLALVNVVVLLIWHQIVLLGFCKAVDCRF